MITHQITNSYGNYSYNAFIYKKTLWDPHFHGNYELIYNIEGSTRVNVNGISDVLDTGEMILVPPYTVHSLEADESSRTWVGVFSPDFISSFSEKNKFCRFSKFRCKTEIEDILKEHLFHEREQQLYMHIGCLYMVCSECINNAQLYASDHDGVFMNKVIKYISENLNEDISLKDTASALNYEYHYFSGLFNRYFSMNFKSFINIFRFEKACKLLTDKNRDMASICSKCGFGSIRNFDRVFKSLSGVTPSEYRKRYLGL